MGFTYAVNNLEKQLKEPWKLKIMINITKLSCFIIRQKNYRNFYWEKAVQFYPEYEKKQWGVQIIKTIFFKVIYLVIIIVKQNCIEDQRPSLSKNVIRGVMQSKMMLTWWFGICILTKSNVKTICHFLCLNQSKKNTWPLYRSATSNIIFSFATNVANKLGHSLHF